MEEAEASDIRQGFICPFCFDDLGDFQHLQAHVDRFHGESTSSDALGQVRDLFGNVTKRIRELPKNLTDSPIGIISGTSAAGRTGGPATGASPASNATWKDGSRERETQPVHQSLPRWHPPPATLGITRSHKEEFVRLRDACVSESAVTTNRLIIRLDKLVNQCPAEPAKRRDFEREVVPWGPDSESAQCTSCAAKFSITRRRHHCRLCGCVMCSTCSRSLSFATARTLTNPSMEESQLAEAARMPSPVGLEGKLEAAGERLVGLGRKTGQILKARLNAASTGGSGKDEVSLASLLQQDAEERLRVCASCLGFLERRAQRMEASEPPALVSLYETLTQLLSHIANLAPSYARMAESLSNGETLYTLESAEAIRTKLLLKQREIDALSQRIANCEGVESAKEQQLRRNIRYVAVNTLQEVVARTSSLPSPETYKELMEEHKARVQRQLEESQRRKADLRLRQSPSNPSFDEAFGSPPSQGENPSRPMNLRTSASFSALRNTTEEGWRPDTTSSTNPFADAAEDEHSQHPLQQQITIIKGYLKQAAEAGRLEEVEMLERNLRDLYEENKRLGLETPRG